MTKKRDRDALDSLMEQWKRDEADSKLQIETLQKELASVRVERQELDTERQTVQEELSLHRQYLLARKNGDAAEERRLLSEMEQKARRGRP